MKTIKFFLILTLSLGTVSSVNAQLWKRITKKIERKVEDKVLNQVDKTIDKSLEENKKADSKENNLSKLEFFSSITFKVSTEKNKDLNFKYFFNDKTDQNCLKIDAKSIGQENAVSGNMYLVYTKDSNTMFMDMGGMKIRKTIKNSPVDGYNYSENIDKTSIKKTGRTKTILGYSCDEYEARHEDGIGSIWATKSAILPLKGTYAPMLGMAGEKSIINGFILEMNFTSKNNEKTSITVTEVKKDDNLTINPNNYRNMGF